MFTPLMAGVSPLPRNWMLTYKMQTRMTLHASHTHRYPIKSSSMASNSSFAKGRLSSSVPNASLRLVIIW